MTKSWLVWAPAGDVFHTAPDASETNAFPGKQTEINYLLLCLERGAACTSAVTVFRDLGGSLGPQSSSHSFLNFSSSAVILWGKNAARNSEY